MRKRSMLAESRGARAFQIAMMACAIVLAGAGAVHAGPADPIKGAFVVDDAEPEKSVPSGEEAMKRPLDMGYYVMSLSDKAEAATKRGDHAAAVKYWRALAKAVPDRSVAFSKICRSYEAAGDLDNALANCRAALGRGGVTVDDNLQFARLVLGKKGALGAGDVADVEAVIAHLEHELGEGGALVTGRLHCDLAIRLEDRGRLERCTKRLQTLAPDDATTITYTWALALQNRDFARAESVLQHAERAKLPAAAIARMTEALDAARSGGNASLWQRAMRDSRVAGALAAIAALAVAVAAAMLLRRQRRPRAA